MDLDATVAGSAANSYLTVAEADELAAVDLVNGDAWRKAPVGDKEKALIAATGYVDAYKKAAGTRWASTQALLFPRLEDAGGDPVAPFLLFDVKRGTYEQAVYLLRNGHLIADAAAHRAQGVISASSGDGGYTAALSPTYGLYAPMMQEYLDRIGAAGRTGRFLVSVPIGSSFPP